MYRGLTPHKIMPMPGTHKTFHLTAGSAVRFQKSVFNPSSPRYWSSSYILPRHVSLSLCTLPLNIIRKKMKKLIAIVLLILFVFNAQAGDFYFNAGTTKSQKETVTKCIRKDFEFSKGMGEALENSDLMLVGIYYINNTYTMRVSNNRYGKWMETSPLYCDLRSEKEKAQEKSIIEARRIARQKKIAHVKAKQAEKNKLRAIEKQEADIAEQEIKERKKAQAQKDAREEAEKRRIKKRKYEKKMAQERRIKKQASACVKKAKTKAFAALKELKKSWSGLRDDYRIEGKSIIATYKIWYDRHQSQLERSVVCNLKG